MKILLAVSGGIDSMCMADMMIRRCTGDDAFAVVHCNFHLRGGESDADQQLVCDWCAGKGIPLRILDFQTADYASRNGISIEMAARELRYGAFAEICREDGFDAVAVAHNANDNAETMILNLLRGTSGRGLCGMKKDGHVPGAPDVRLLRPLLDMPRSDIAAYAAENGIPFREDRTNSDTSFKRNRIRHEVFPVFERINPSFLSTLNREAAIFSQQEEILDDYIRRCREEVVESDGRISCGKLTSLQGWKFVLFRLTEACSLSTSVFDDLTEAVRKGCPVSGKVFQGADGRVVTTDGGIVIDPGHAEGPLSLTITAPGTYRFRERKLKVEVFDRPEDFSPVMEAGQQVFDATALPFPLKLRSWESGDWIRPLGMNGRRKKLSDLFVDLGYSLVDKDNAVLLEEDGHHIAALLGCRTDEGLKVTPETGRILKITIAPDERRK